MTPAEACVDFFEKNEGNREKVKSLMEIEDRFVWETLSSSRFSPAPVKSELVVRQIHDPVYWNKDKGELTPEAFDDMCNKGLSTDRLRYTSVEAVTQAGIERAAQYNQANPEKRPRTLIALAQIHSDEIRAHKSNSLQTLGIYDTAIEDNVAHADVCLLVTGKQNLRSVREHLFRIVKINPVTIT